MPYCGRLSVAYDLHLLDDENLDEADKWFDKFSSLSGFWDNYGCSVWRPRYLKYFAPWHSVFGISDCESYEEAFLRNEIACNEKALAELKLMHEFEEYIENKKRRQQNEHIGKEQEKTV